MIYVTLILGTVALDAQGGTMDQDALQVMPFFIVFFFHLNFFIFYIFIFFLFFIFLYFVYVSKKLLLEKSIILLSEKLQVMPFFIVFFFHFNFFYILHFYLFFFYFVYVSKKSLPVLEKSIILLSEKRQGSTAIVVALSILLVLVLVLCIIQFLYIIHQFSKGGWASQRPPDSPVGQAVSYDLPEMVRTPNLI